VRKLIFVLFLMAGLASAQLALLDMAMPEARFLLGINVERIQASRFGQFIWSQVPVEEPEIAKFVEASGFNPFKDLREIVVAAPAKSQPQRVLFAVRGSFDRARFLSMLRVQGSGSEIHRGVEIVTARKQQEPMALAFLDDSTLIGGDPVSVRDAITRRGQPAQLLPALREKAGELSGRLDLWFVSVIPVSELAGKVPDQQVSGALQGDALKSIEQMNGGIRFGPSLELSLTAVTRGEQEAEALANVVRFLIGLARSRQPAGQTSLTENLTVKGNTVNLALVIPQEEVEKMVLAARKSAPRRTGPAASAPAQPTGVTIYSSPSDMGVVKIPPPKP